MGSGLIVEYSQATRIDSIRLTTAADRPDRDPMKIAVFGSNDPIDWASQSWNLIANDLETGLSTNRQASVQLDLPDAPAYKYYRVVFTELRELGTDAAQIAEIDLVPVAGPLLIAGTGLNATISVAGYTGGIIDGRVAAAVLPGEGLAFTLDARAQVPVPGLDLKLFGQVEVGMNLSDGPVDQSIVVGGETLSLSFDEADETRFNLSDLDASLEGVLGNLLSGTAREIARFQLQLQEAEPLPILNRSVDEILQLSPYLAIGQHVLDYMAQPVEQYGLQGVPTVRGLQAYLAEVLELPQNESGLIFNFDENGLTLGLDVAFDVTVNDVEIDLAQDLGALGLRLEGDVRIDAQFV